MGAPAIAATGESVGIPIRVLIAEDDPAMRSAIAELIQFTPASGFHLTVLFLSFVQNSIELLPVISPTPNLLSFHPPKLNGSRGTGTPTFTPIIPALA